MVDHSDELIEMTATIVAAYVGNHRVNPADLPSIVTSTYAALAGAERPAEPEAVALRPAASARKSITGERLICLDCGKPFASIKRHLNTAHGLTPQGYRERWSLAKNYPMVAPAYSEARSRLAKEVGLGQGGRGAKSAPPAKASGKRQPGEPVKPARRTLKLKFEDVAVKDGVTGGTPVRPEG